MVHVTPRAAGRSTLPGRSAARGLLPDLLHYLPMSRQILTFSDAASVDENGAASPAATRFPTS